MTKIVAIKKVLEANKGVATLATIYKDIDKFYDINKNTDWMAGIRGVLYRDIRENNNFKKIGFSLYALKDYKEEEFKNLAKDKVRMHSHMEGICLEIGNLLNFDTYTADPSAFYNNVLLSELASLKTIPSFTYKEIIETTTKIDILWFNKKGFAFPQKAIEVVDSINTLESALKRTLQLAEFNLSFFILCKSSDESRVLKAIEKEPYKRIKDRYIVQNYETVLEAFKSPFVNSDNKLFEVNSVF